MADTVDKFASLFRGNQSFYVRHEPPFTRNEELGKVKAKFCGVALGPGKEPLPVVKEKYREHLNGGEGMAIEPLCESNKCFFSVIDIDIPDINYTSLIQRLYMYNFKFAPFVSKSGGLHIYFFFRDPEKGKDTIETITRVVTVFGLNRLYVNGKGKSRVEVFPKHGTLKPDDRGSCVFLPYYNAAESEDTMPCRQKMITAEGKLVSIDKAIKFIEEGCFTSLVDINESIDKLPYSDAPFCVQMIALTGALGDGDGRSDYLFSAGVYLKKKQKEEFFNELMEINNLLAEPMGEPDVRSTYKSVMGKDFQYKCKSGPCAEYCDTRECKKREYGVGKDKGNHFTGFACWGEISRVNTAEPYYIWKVQVDEGGEFKELKLDCADDLMNQNIVTRACVTHLNKAPLPVKQYDWVVLVNQSLAGIEERQIEVAESTDTTESNELNSYIKRFLAYEPMHCVAPYRIQMNQVYLKDDVYYFTTDGIKEYIRLQRYNLGRINLRERLIKYGCTEAEITYKVRDEDRVIKCWKKVKDDTLGEMESFYSDVAKIESDIIDDNPLNKIGEGEVHNDDETDTGSESSIGPEVKF